MKNIMIAIFAVIALVLSVASASAAVTVTSSYSSSSPTFGSDSQMASNPDADDESDEDIYDTADINLNNSGTSDVTISTVEMTSLESGFSASDINISVTDADKTIAANGSEPVTFQARIPEELDAVDSDMDEKAFKVGTATITFTDSSTTTFDVYMQRKNMLSLEKVYVSINGQRKRCYDGKDTDEAKPGDDIDVEVKVENLYDNDDETEIDVGIDVEVEDLDDADGDASVELDADEEETKTISFKVEEDADDDTYDMEIIVEGDDDHGARHGAKWNIDFEVEREAHDIIIKSSSLGVSTASCSRDDNSVYVKLYNLGRNDEDEVALYITNKDIGIEFEKEDIEIEEDEYYTKTLSFDVPEDLAEGTYSIEVKAYYSGNDNDGVLADLVDLELDVEDCESEETTTTTAATTTATDSAVNTIDSGDVEVTVPDEVLEEFGIVETEESSVGGAGFIILLSVAVILSLGGVSALIIYLIKTL